MAAPVDELVTASDVNWLADLRDALPYGKKHSARPCLRRPNLGVEDVPVRGIL